MCRRVWLIALLTTALSVATTLLLVREGGWSAGSVLSLLTLMLSMLVVVITYLKRDASDCGPIIYGDASDLSEEA